MTSMEIFPFFEALSTCVLLSSLYTFLKAAINTFTSPKLRKPLVSAKYCQVCFAFYQLVF